MIRTPLAKLKTLLFFLKLPQAYNERVNSAPFKLRFWGVRGSIASNASRIGSHTSCVELEIDKQTSFFFDAGTGIRNASHQRVFKEITLFLSHFHWDHIQGLPFLTALGDPECRIEIITGFKDGRDRLEHLFDERFHPVPLGHYIDRLSVTYLPEGQSLIRQNLRIETAALNHPGTSHAFLIEHLQTSLLYATDSDYAPVPPAAQKLFERADWAIMDSQFLLGDSIKKYDYGHSSFQNAVDTCAKFGVKECFLFHFDPNYTDEQLLDMERQAKAYALSRYGEKGPAVLAASEGFERHLLRQS